MAAGGLAAGSDAETDESLRARVLRRIQKPPQGGAGYDYVAWALEVPGVTRAWVYPAEMGLGTVTVRFVRDLEQVPAWARGLDSAATPNSVNDATFVESRLHSLRTRQAAPAGRLGRA